MLKTLRFFTALFGTGLALFMNIIPQTAVAHDWTEGPCGGGMVCLTWNGSSWFVSGPSLGSSNTTIDLSQMKFNSSTQTNTVEVVGKDNLIIKKYNPQPSGSNAAQFKFVPKNLKWSNTYQGFYLDNEDYKNIIFTFNVGYKMGSGGSSLVPVTSVSGTSVVIPSNVIPNALSASDPIYYYVQVSAKAVGSVSSSVPISNLEIFEVYFLPIGGKMGSILISGTTPNLNPPTTKTCEVKTSNQNMVVILPTVGRQTLQQNGTTGRMPFQIELVNCQANAYSKGKRLYATFRSVYLDENTGTLKNAATTGKANNVNVQLTNSDGSAIKISNELMDAASMASYKSNAILDSSQTNYTLGFNAQYYATGTVTAGNVETSATFVVEYR